MREASNAAICLVSAQGGPWRRLTSEEFLDNLPAWSHDERSIYFRSTRTGHGEYYRIPIEGGQALQLTDTGAFEAHESPDGGCCTLTKAAALMGSGPCRSTADRKRRCRNFAKPATGAFGVS